MYSQFHILELIWFGFLKTYCYLFATQMPIQYKQTNFGYNPPTLILFYRVFTVPPIIWTSNTKFKPQRAGLFVLFFCHPAGFPWMPLLYPGSCQWDRRADRSQSINAKALPILKVGFLIKFKVISLEGITSGTIKMSHPSQWMNIKKIYTNRPPLGSQNDLGKVQKRKQKAETTIDGKPWKQTKNYICFLLPKSRSRSIVAKAAGFLSMCSGVLQCLWVFT